ncbi:hypothetical protein N431DRAFT_344499 [Stipitochalara longipes BDJ]|nr:hypothetical protein N431DRAFT_344499 [Stipitochalara longipes BDJ]
MFLSSSSQTASRPPLNTSAAASPLMTIMHATLSVSSTVPTVKAIAFDLNPYATDMDEPYYTFSRKESESPSLYSRCGLLWRTSFFQWISTAVENSTLLDEFTCFRTATRNPVWDCETADKEWELVTTFYSEAEAFPFTASPPCCGGCTFTAGDVQVYHWPATTSPLVSLLTNSQGFTFTYPSVYVAFQTIAARDLCGVVGTAVKGVTTIAFNASELSTAASYTAATSGPVNGENAAWVITRQSWWTYAPIDWQTSMTCTDIKTTVWTRNGGDLIVYTASTVDAFTFTFPGYNNSATTQAAYTTAETLSAYGPWVLTYNPCTPFLSIPSRIIAIDPLWNTCYRDFKGLHDPPILLTPANGFFPIKTTAPGSPPKETQGASAGQAIPLPLITKTLSPKVSALPAIATIGRTTITANIATVLVIGTQTLGPGEEITNSGTLLSMASNGRELVIGSSTQLLAPAYVIGTQTLFADGPPLTVDGTVMSLMGGSGAGGESVVIGDGSGGSLTEDASVLTGTGLWAGKGTASVGGGGGPGDSGGSESTSGSAKLEVGALIRWQILLFYLVTYYGR